MSPRTECREMLRSEEVEREPFAHAFEAAPPAERVAIIEAIDGRGQAKLWRAAAGQAVSIEEMVPRDLGPLRPVIFHGKNSLPVFTRFEKRFCRPAPGVERDELWGFNFQPVAWLAPLTGPGYFVAYDTPAGIGAVAVDYRRIPAGRPPGWPELHDNTYRLSRFIYNGMVDYLRRVSRHLLIGRATRGEKELPNYFLLCREDPS